MRLSVEEREGDRGELRTLLERMPGIGSLARVSDPVDRPQVARRSFDSSLLGPADELPVRIFRRDSPHAWQRKPDAGPLLRSAPSTPQKGITRCRPTD